MYKINYLSANDARICGMGSKRNKEVALDFARKLAAGIGRSVWVTFKDRLIGEFDGEPDEEQKETNKMISLILKERGEEHPLRILSDKKKWVNK